MVMNTINTYVRLIVKTIAWLIMKSLPYAYFHIQSNLQKRSFLTKLGEMECNKARLSDSLTYWTDLIDF